MWSGAFSEPDSARKQVYEPKAVRYRMRGDQRVQCAAEAFDSTRQILFLIHPQNSSAFRVAV
jgi:hypothetical protein